jgi:nitronate monooxygenase
MFFKTELTTRLGLRLPVLAAPLGRGSTPEFLGALTSNGAMGFVALMHMPEAEVRPTLLNYVATNGGGDRFGINLTLIVDQTRRLEAALDVGCRIVSLWQGDPARYARRAKDAGATVFWTASGPADAARAADLGVDFLVAQGREAGGHLVGEGPLMTLLPAVVDAARGVPVIAAGGIADGRGLAAALALGACGVWMGTCFVASKESGNHPGYKQRMVQATLADLVETTLFDGGWPDSPHRVIRNSTVANWEEMGCPKPGHRPGEGEQIGVFPNGEPMLRYNVATPWAAMEGDWEACPHYAGASAALVNAIEPVAAILARIEADAAAALTVGAHVYVEG